MVYLKCLIVSLLLVLDQRVEPAKQNRFFCYRAKHECPTNDILFFFYTRATQFDPIVLNMKEPDEILKAPFDFTRPLTVILHGYTGWKDYSPNTELRPAFFESGEQNIISVDYNPLVLEPCYYTATQNLQVVANCTAQILDFMVAKRLFKLENIHIIGFSLGAQAAGMVANYIKSGQLDHITGLDPAKPLFVTAPNHERLDKGDAKFVDVIHTDVFSRGVLQSAGHLDFYANGGIDQPGCGNINFIRRGECNHDRAPMFYAESIGSPIGFWGYRCSHWYSYALGLCRARNSKEIALFGYHSDRRLSGLFFFNTNSESPFAQGTNFSRATYFETAGVMDSDLDELSNETSD